MDTTTRATRAAEIKAELAHYCGTTEVYRVAAAGKRMVYTEGVRAMAQLCGAYWLIGEIQYGLSSRQMAEATSKDERLRDMVFFDLSVEDREGVLTARADSCEPLAYHKEVEFTDFPLDQIDLWAQFDGERWTLMLPSEY